jgi:parallel beta-helix repeat protein
MARLPSALAAVLGGLFACVPPALGAVDPVEGSGSTTVNFSKDEGTVVIRHHGRTWTVARPVVSPWTYKARGRVYWVAPAGRDSNPGTAQRPLRHIATALSRALAGDVVYVRAGTYVESLVLSRSDHEGRPIVLSCAPGELGRVKVTPPREYVEKNPHGAVVTLTNGAQHVWINGLVIEGPKGRPEAPRMETFGGNGITWSGKAGLGCRATNNVVYGNVHCGIKEMGHGGAGLFVEGNVIFDNGTEGRDHGIYMPASDVRLNGNVIFDHPGWGIHSYSSPKRQLITRNVCFGNKAGGIILAGSDNKVYHNVCASNGQGIFYFRKGCVGNDVRDNIFAFNKTDCGYDNGGGKLGDPSDNTDDYNCYFPGKPSRYIAAGRHEVLASPRFRDANKGDFRLLATSPCRGRAAVVEMPGGKKGTDLGAFLPGGEESVQSSRRDQR